MNRKSIITTLFLLITLFAPLSIFAQADVFKYLCDALEIECIKVSGYARGYGRDLFRSEDVTISDHAWNIVTIQGKKHLILALW